ncbi:tenomodulin [Cynoglossus semilaevis]|uniref:Tenomodulin n=1 Tax=Cynoglossus semilaevis TaxID=244447 RepID=A0A3P8UPU2_CYNSE|nr:tenomodulin [Cynoglossus semilaevis]XP_024919030.1 tenomodulin [Cynoglossus semilaevis]
MEKMENQPGSQQVLWKDVEEVREKKSRYQTYQKVALALTLTFLVLALSALSLTFLWSPTVGKVYEHPYKAILDGVETEGLLEIDPDKHVEIFRMGNGSTEVLEIHDFKHGLTGIRFAEHQRCYIRTQSRNLPSETELRAEDTQATKTDETDDLKVEDSQVWVPAEEPVVNLDFLQDSKIWEICQNMPIHWIHPSPLSDAEMSNVDSPDTEVAGQRFARDVRNHPAVSDYRDVGIELDNRLDERGYCCQYCQRGYRYCRRYYEPLGGFNPWPYYYQGGRVICQIVMPCNWWIARMLGRV